MKINPVFISMAFCFSVRPGLIVDQENSINTRYAYLLKIMQALKTKIYILITKIDNFPQRYYLNLCTANDIKIGFSFLLNVKLRYCKAQENISSHSLADETELQKEDCLSHQIISTALLLSSIEGENGLGLQMKQRARFVCNIKKVSKAEGLLLVLLCCRGRRM